MFYNKIKRDKRIKCWVNPVDLMIHKKKQRTNKFEKRIFKRMAHIYILHVA